MARERGETQGDVEEISRAGDEGFRVELGPGDEACNGQATLAIFGVLNGYTNTCFILCFAFNSISVRICTYTININIYEFMYFVEIRSMFMYFIIFVTCFVE